MRASTVAIYEYGKTHSDKELEGLIERLIAKDKWVTIKGTHIKLDKNNRPISGPKRLRKEIQKNSGFLKNNQVYDLCKLDKNIYSCVTNDIKTDDVVITGERVKHIREEHPEIREEEAFEMIKNAVVDPDVIIKDKYAEHVPDTAVIMKRFPGKKVANKKGEKKNANMRLILRIQTSKDENDNYKNSVITAMIAGDRTWKKTFSPDKKNKVKILYKKPGIEL